MMQLNNFRDEVAIHNPSIQQLQENVKAALELVMGDSSPEMLDEMSTIFLEDAIPLIQQMKVGEQNGDYKAVAIAAHTLKGSSATIGLKKFAERCLDIELNSKPQQADQLGKVIARLEADYVHIEKALRRFLL